MFGLGLATKISVAVEAMIEREAGVEISRATLDGWVMRVGELLQPVAEAMRAGAAACIVFTGR